MNMEVEKRDSKCKAGFTAAVSAAVVACSLSIVSILFTFYSMQTVADLKTQQMELDRVIHSIAENVLSETSTKHQLSKRSTTSEEELQNKLVSGEKWAIFRGPPGRDGKDGRDGRDCNGTPDNHLIQQIVSRLGSGGNGTGSEYVRWGRKECSNTSQILYEGFVAGKQWAHHGGGSNYLCLPHEPEWSNFRKPQDEGSWIYGGEYRDYNNGLFPTNMENKNVPCARCYVPLRTTTMMIPAKRTCPDTWTKEYEGYLMAGHHTHPAAFNYICVDRAPEAVPGRDNPHDGSLLYFVQNYCPSTGHCPPYINSAELTCVVCSK